MMRVALFLSGFISLTPSAWAAGFDSPLHSVAWAAMSDGARAAAVMGCVIIPAIVLCVLAAGGRKERRLGLALVGVLALLWGSYARLAGTIYYIDPVGGASGNDGLSEAAPKSAYSQLAPSAGDIIYFKRGTTHSGQITCTSGSSPNYTIYGAYGTGANPILTTNNNVFLCQDRDFVRWENLTIRPTLATAAGIRADRPEDLVIDGVEFDGTGGGLDGIRMEAISTGGSQTFNRVTIRNSWFHDFAQGDGIRAFIGATDAAVVAVGVTVTGNTFERIGKAPARFSYQNASFGVRDHLWRSFVFTDNVVRESLNSTPTTIDDDQCLHFRNVRETTFGNSIIARNRITNCGRNASQASPNDTTLITGFWFEGMTKVIVMDNIGEDIRTPRNDGGIFFLDSNTAAADQYVTTGNHFLRNRASSASGNEGCVPFTATQCNNSEGFSVTRGASGNYFIANIAYGNPIGFHVTGNAGVNYWYHNAASANKYGYYLQTNSGDTPAGLAQVMRNNVGSGNYTFDYRHGSTPKADEQYNLFRTMDGDTQDATSLTSDPKFIGGTNPMTPEGFRPRADSPLCGAGIHVGKLYDKAGRKYRTPPSIGAFECRGGRAPISSRRAASVRVSR